MRLNALFAENLRRLRKENGLSREYLSQLCGLSFSYIGRLERGDQSPTLDTIESLALALQVAPQDLIAYPDEKS